MMIHELKPEHPTRKKKRIGRGGKRGTTSGKGQKGQRARAGHRIRPAERDTIQRLPKLRGVKNVLPRRRKTIILHTGMLQKIAEEKKINKGILLKKGIIKEMSDAVKILYDRDPGTPLSVEGVKCSAEAKKAILKAHGSVS